MSKKQALVSHRKRHDAYQHNVVPRLEGVVKNKGIKPVRKKRLPKRIKKEVEKEAERYAGE